MWEAEWACEGCIDMAFGYEEAWTSPLSRVLSFDSGGFERSREFRTTSQAVRYVLVGALK